MEEETTKLGIPDELITSKIYLIKYKKVMLDEDLADLMSQFATSNRGGRRKLPNAYSELGVAMLSSV